MSPSRILGRIAKPLVDCLTQITRTGHIIVISRGGSSQKFLGLSPWKVSTATVISVQGYHCLHKLGAWEKTGGRAPRPQPRTAPGHQYIACNYFITDVSCTSPSPPQPTFMVLLRQRQRLFSQFALGLYRLLLHCCMGRASGL